MEKTIINIYRNLLNGYYKVANSIVFKINHVTKPKTLRIQGRICFSGTRKVEIGKNVFIISTKSANKIGGDIRTSFTTYETGSIKIGDNVGISNSAFVSSERIEIGNNVLIGASCKFYDSDLHSIKYEQRLQSPDLHIHKKEIIISEGAFIGAHSIILKGVTIGKRSVIGAGSVVTKSVPDDEIWAGNPIRFVKKINQEAL